MKNTRQPLIIATLAAIIGLSFVADWIGPDRVFFVAYSYYVLSIYSLRTFLFCLLLFALMDVRNPCHVLPWEALALLPSAVNGAIILFGFSFNAILAYSRIATVAQTILAFLLIVRFVRMNAVSEIDGGYRLDKLSKRELEVARLMLEGKKTDEIARLLFISNATVKSHIQSIFRKYGVNTRMEFAHRITGHQYG